MARREGEDVPCGTSSPKQRSHCEKEPDPAGLRPLRPIASLFPGARATALVPGESLALGRNGAQREQEILWKGGRERFIDIKIIFLISVRTMRD